MSKKGYYKTVSSVFLIVGLMHLWRIVAGWEAVMGGVVIPMWFSWAAVLLTAYLSYRGFTFAAKLARK